MFYFVLIAYSFAVWHDLISYIGFLVLKPHYTETMVKSKILKQQKVR